MENKKKKRNSFSTNFIKYNFLDLITSNNLRSLVTELFLTRY